jgi:hypothetical protein
MLHFCSLSNHVYVLFLTCFPYYHQRLSIYLDAGVMGYFIFLLFISIL